MAEAVRDYAFLGKMPFYRAILAPIDALSGGLHLLLCGLQ